MLHLKYLTEFSEFTSGYVLIAIYMFVSNFFFNENEGVNSEKQPQEVFCKKRCSEKFRKIHRKAPMPETLF